MYLVLSLKPSATEGATAVALEDERQGSDEEAAAVEGRPTAQSRVRTGVESNRWEGD